MNKNKEMPKVALGTWSWGVGMAGGDQVFGNHYNENDLKDVFDEALKSGLNLWDTAVVYGMGDSERIVSEMIKNYDNDDVIISTKFTPQIADNSKNPVESMCNGSLKRLDVDYIDIYWIHNPENVEKWTPLLIPLIKSGKVKRVGVSNHNLNQIKRVEEILSKENCHISAVQNHFSLLYRSSEEAGILDYCKENNIDFFAYMVLEQGALTGKYNVKNPLPENSQRAQTYNPILSKLEVLIEEMRKIGMRYQVSISQVATAYTIAKGAIPIVGVTKTKHVKEAKEAASIVLNEREIKLLEKLAEDTGVDTKGSWENSMTC